MKCNRNVFMSKYAINATNTRFVTACNFQIRNSIVAKLFLVNQVAIQNMTPTKALYVMDSDEMNVEICPFGLLLVCVCVSVCALHCTMSDEYAEYYFMCLTGSVSI